MAKFFINNKRLVLSVVGIVAIVGGVMWKTSTQNTFEPVNEAKQMYDVIVVGSDPEGISAAVSAARNGQEVLLVDKRTEVGGLMTIGGLNTLDMNFGPKNKLLTRGIFEEFFNQTHWLNFTGITGISRYSYDIEEATNIFHKMLGGEDNLDVVLGVTNIHPEVEGNEITGISFEQDDEEVSVEGLRIIDATQDADIAALAGVPYSIGMADLHKDEYQAVTLVFKVDGVDWKALRKALDSEENKHSSSSTKYSAWGFKEVMKEYEPVHDHVKVRAPNIGLQNDGSILINAIQILGIDGLSEADKQRAYEIGKKEAEHVTDYMRENLPGFEEATYAGVVEELYVRETRHIEGEYTLDIIDLVENRDFEDKIALGSYPVDIQTTAMTNTGYVFVVPEVYSIPFRSIVPKEIENLLVVGRAASYSSLAHGSARVIPIGMAVGEAAGVAAAYGIENNKDFRAIAYNEEDIKAIQKQLKKQGAYLEDFEYPSTYDGHWATEGIRFMIRMGILTGGYENDFGLENSITEGKFLNWMIQSVNRSGIGTNKVNMNYSEEYIDLNKALEMMVSFLDLHNEGEPREIIESLGIITQGTLAQMEQEISIASAAQLIYEMNVYLGYK